MLSKAGVVSKVLFSRAIPSLANDSRSSIPQSLKPSPMFKRHRLQTKGSKSSDDHMRPHLGQRANKREEKQAITCDENIAPKYHADVRPIIIARRK